MEDIMIILAIGFICAFFTTTTLLIVGAIKKRKMKKSLEKILIAALVMDRLKK